MKTYTASRVSEGNTVFPAKIILSNSGVTLKVPGFFSGKEKTIPFTEISSVSTDCPLVGYSTIIIETTGSGRIKAHGFTKGNVNEMKESILGAKNGELSFDTHTSNKTNEKTNEINLSNDVFSWRMPIDHLETKEPTEEERQQYEKRREEDKRIDKLIEEYKGRLSPEELKNRDTMLAGCLRLIKDDEQKVETKREMFLQRFDLIEPDEAMSLVNEGKVVFSFSDVDGEEEEVRETDIKYLDDDYIVGVFKNTELAKQKNAEFLLNTLSEFIVKNYSSNKPEDDQKKAFYLIKSALESCDSLNLPKSTEYINSHFKDLLTNAEFFIDEFSDERALTEMKDVMEYLWP